MPSFESPAYILCDASEDLRIARLGGHEAVSEPFLFDVDFSSDTVIAPTEFLGKPLAVELQVADSPVRYFHGIVKRLTRGDVEGQAAGQKHATFYRAEIVPKPWLLGQEVDCRIFQDLTVKDILQQALTDMGLTSGTDFKISLQKTYTKRTYCVQYRETTWDFLNRLMEDEGIFFFFEHAKTSHTMVIADVNSVFVAVPGAPNPMVYEMHLGGTREDERVWNGPRPTRSIPRRSPWPSTTSSSPTRRSPAIRRPRPGAHSTRSTITPIRWSPPSTTRRRRRT